MDADRELDALISKKVMGWYVYDRAEVRDYPPPDWDGFVIDTNPQGYYWSLPHYSTDIAAAWEVVTAVISRPNTNGVALRNNASGGWMARFFDPDGGIGEPFDFFAQADTGPLAICLAALAVVGAALPQKAADA